MLVWLNGHFVTLAEAKVSAFDAGFQHGVGLFETMAARNGRVVRGVEHLTRLAESARTLRLADALRIEPLLDAVELTLQRNNLAEARIRLTLTGGDLNLLATVRTLKTETQKTAAPDPTILIHAQPPTPYPEAFFEKGVNVTIADGRLNPFERFVSHKTLSYWPRLSALQAAATAGAGEALWFTATNHLAGGSVSNVFLVKGGGLLTPIARGEEVDVAGPGVAAIPSPVLPGITRAAVIRFAADEGIAVTRQMLDINDLLSADEVFLTNSSWGVLPVVQVERQVIGNGAVGRLTEGLRQAWRVQFGD